MQPFKKILYKLLYQQMDKIAIQTIITNTLLDKYLYVHDKYIDQSIIREDIMKLFSEYEPTPNRNSIKKLARNIDKILMININVKSKYYKKIEQEIIFYHHFITNDSKTTKSKNNNQTL